jgi:hypothetical protein
MNEAAADRVECPAAKDPAVRLFIGAAMGIAFGVYCWWDAEAPPPAWSLSHINQAASYVLHVAGPWVFGIPGVLAGIWGVVFLRRVLVADAEGIGYAGKERVAWDDVTNLDASDLKKKGILYLEYGDDEVLKLDSWKLQNFKQLVAFVEAHVPAEARQEGGPQTD